MSPEEAEKLFRQGIAVRRQDVTLAKAFLLGLPRSERHRFDAVLAQYLKTLGFAALRRLSLRPEPDAREFEKAQGDINARLALVEAIWDLVHTGIITHRGQVTQVPIAVEWTTIVAGSGQSGGWSFDDFALFMPVDFSFSPSYREPQPEEALTNPDLFLLEAGIPQADPEVLEALVDSIGCFRAGLYRASVILLGKAMEGAWTEFGLALAKTVPTGCSIKVSDFSNMIQSDAPLARKLAEIRKVYSDKTLAGKALNDAQMRASDLEEILVWSEILRDARNAIHFGVKPAIPNSYEKVAVLLLAGGKYLPILYRMKQANS